MNCKFSYNYIFFNFGRNVYWKSKHNQHVQLGEVPFFELGMVPLNDINYIGQLIAQIL